MYVNHLVHTIDNDLISIGALNTDDGEAIESMLPHGVTNERSAEHDVAGISDGQNENGRHIRELLCHFIKAVFVQYVNDFCRCFY